MRVIDKGTLHGFGKHLATEFPRPSVPTPTGRWMAGRSYVIDSLYDMTFKDEFEEVMDVMIAHLGEDEKKEFKRLWSTRQEVRSEHTFEALLAERFAINPAGEHIPGRIGKVEIGTRKVGTIVKEIPRYASNRRSMKQRLTFVNGTLMDRMFFRARTTPEIVEMRYVTRSLKWPVYAGEIEERLAESGVADVLPEGAQAFSPFPHSVLATNPKMSNECAILAADAIVDNLDEGTTAATIRGRTGTQPADVDSNEDGTLLFTLTCSDPAFGNATDDTGKATATASAITDDSSADATGTLGYCRVGATGTGADDHLDGEAGTSASDFNFNTLSIVSGTNVSMSSFTVSVSE